MFAIHDYQRLLIKNSKIKNVRIVEYTLNTTSGTSFTPSHAHIRPSRVVHAHCNSVCSAGDMCVIFSWNRSEGELFFLALSHRFSHESMSSGWIVDVGGSEIFKIKIFEKTFAQPVTSLPRCGCRGHIKFRVIFYFHLYLYNIIRIIHIM